MDFFTFLSRFPEKDSKLMEAIKLGYKAIYESPDQITDGQDTIKTYDPYTVSFGYNTNNGNIACSMFEESHSQANIYPSKYNVSGRLFVKNKIISLWNNIDKDTLNEIVNSLNAYFIKAKNDYMEYFNSSKQDKRDESENEYVEYTSITIDNSWRVESPEAVDVGSWLDDWKIVPISEYEKSDNVDEEQLDKLKELHTMNSAEKNRALKDSGVTPKNVDLPNDMSMAEYRYKTVAESV